MKNKIVELAQLPQHASAFRAAGKKLVATNGCFDLLHVGHVRYLCAARALGDVLVVGVNGDESTRMLKGAGRPINNERDRAEVLAALECVDVVAIFPELRAVKFIEAVQPAVYVKGGDYTVASLNEEERAALQWLNSEIRLVPFESGYSTTRLLEQLPIANKQ